MPALGEALGSGAAAEHATSSDATKDALTELEIIFHTAYKSFNQKVIVLDVDSLSPMSGQLKRACSSGTLR